MIAEAREIRENQTYRNISYAAVAAAAGPKPTVTEESVRTQKNCIRH